MEVHDRILRKCKGGVVDISGDAPTKAKGARKTEAVGNMRGVIEAVAASHNEFFVDCVSKSKPWRDHLPVSVLEALTPKIVHEHERPGPSASSRIRLGQVDA